MEDDLIRRAQDGERGAFDQLVDTFTKGEVDAPLTSVMGMKRRRSAC